MNSSRPDTLNRAPPTWFNAWVPKPQHVHVVNRQQARRADPQYLHLDDSPPELYFEDNGETFRFFPYTIWQETDLRHVRLAYTSCSDLRYYMRSAERLLMKLDIAGLCGVQVSDLQYRLYGEDLEHLVPITRTSDLYRTLYGWLNECISTTQPPMLSLLRHGSYSDWLCQKPWNLSTWSWRDGMPIHVRTPHIARVEDIDLRWPTHPIWATITATLERIEADFLIRISDLGGFDLNEKIQDRLRAKVEQLETRHRIPWDTYQL